jgi:hypothetical protein
VGVLDHPLHGGPVTELLEGPLAGRRWTRRAAEYVTAPARAFVPKPAVLVAGTYPLAEAAKAHAEGETGGVTGKLVLTVPP